MGAISQNARYSNMLAAWQKCRDCYGGERVVKSKGKTYLPPTAGMVLDGFPNTGENGTQDYEAYKLRAVFPAVLQDAVNSAVGMLNHKDAVILLPEEMEYLRSHATKTGDGLLDLLRRVNTQQFMTGRVILVADSIIHDGKPECIIALYYETALTDWYQPACELQFAKFQEKKRVLKPTDLSWKEVTDTILLAKLEGEKGERVLSDTGVYCLGRFEGEDAEIDLNACEPMLFRGNTSPDIPMVIINATDLNPEPSDPPLEPVADSDLTIYRGEADYRQHLFQMSQDTLVIIGGDDEDASNKRVRTGAGTGISIPKGGDAKFIGTNSSGLMEQREALQNDYKRAFTRVVSMSTDSQGGGAESGEALRIRVSARTATLPSVAMAAAKGLENLLKMIAVWMGCDENKVSVTPNMEFSASTGDATTLGVLMAAKAQGLKISDQSIHEWMAENGFVTRSFEDEEKLLNSEPPLPNDNVEGGQRRKNRDKTNENNDDDNGIDKKPDASDKKENS